MGRSRYRILQHGVGGKMGTKEDCCICPIPFSWFWTPFSTMCLLKVWFFMNHLFRDSQQVPLDSACLSLKQFWCIFPMKINKMWNFCLKLWFFRNSYCKTGNAIGFGMPQTLNMHHSSHFNAFFPVKINKMWNFWLFPELPLTKKLKKMSICTGKKCLQRLANMHI